VARAARTSRPGDDALRSNPLAAIASRETDKVHQAEFRTRLEGAHSMAIFTTTHLHRLDDALINRFSVNLYGQRKGTLS
jgi:hypothetical protein